MNIMSAIEIYINYCKKIGLAKTTIPTYEYNLRRFKDFLIQSGIDVNNADVSVLTKIIIKEFLVYEQANFYISTVKLRKAILSGFFNWLVEDCGFIDVNPVSSIKLRIKHENKKLTAVTQQEIQMMYEYFENIPYKNRAYRYYLYRLIIAMLYGTGIRVGSLIKLKHENYNREERSIRFTGKGEKDLSIFFPDGEIPKYIDILKEYTCSDYIISHTTGKPFSSTGINVIVKKVCKNSGIERNLSPHSFRRGYATAMIDNGVDLAFLKRCMGHSDIQTTLRYIKLSEKSVSDVMKNNCPLNNIMR